MNLSRKCRTIDRCQPLRETYAAIPFGKENGMTDSETSGGIALPTVRIEPVDKPHNVLALGCWAFGGREWGGQDDADSMAAMETAYAAGISHFDTAIAYGGGASERVVGGFLAGNGRREKVFLATKGNTANARGEEITDSLDRSLANLAVDCIDLYYIHWPRKGKDMRPVMEALEAARRQGKIHAVGVSNFSVEQMAAVGEVGTINAHQMCYNLFWRYPEADVIPYCREHDIAVVTYSTIAEGILTGKFPREVRFGEDDHRRHGVLFDSEVWPHVYDAVEHLKAIAAEAARPLVELAIRWVASRPSVTSTLVGARNAAQAAQNAAAMRGEISRDVLESMTAVSDEAVRHVPDVGNIFRWYP